MSEGPIFIVGMPRSGTTLLRALITAHPDIAIGPETHFLRRLEQYGQRDFESFWERYCRSRSFESLGLDAEVVGRHILERGPFAARNAFATLLQDFARSKHKQRVGEKTPRHFLHLETLISWFPDCRVIWIVRDPRGVCNSYQDVFWRSLEGRGLKNLEPASIVRGRRVFLDARLWQEHIDLLRDKWIGDPHIELIRYEDLVAAPLSAMDRMGDHIGANFDEAILNPTARSGIAPEVLLSGASGEWQMRHFDQATGPIRKEGAHRWRRQLKGEDIRLVERICESGMKCIGYTPEGGKAKTLREYLRYTFLYRWSWVYWRIRGTQSR